MELQEFWGVEFTDVSGDQAVGTCPFCDKERHFYASSQGDLWDCKSCGKSGNQYKFITELYEHHKALGSDDNQHLQHLADNRKLPRYLFEQAGIVYSEELGYYLIPFVGKGQYLSNLGRVYIAKGTKVYKSPGFDHDLFFPTQCRELQDQVILCEGEWDALACIEYLTNHYQGGADWSVVGVPGADVFKPQWEDIFKGKHVTIWYDNDDAGKRGLIKASKGCIKGGAKSTTCFIWPEDYLFPSSKGVADSGKDIRDYVVHAKVDELSITESHAFFEDNQLPATELESLDATFLEARYRLPPMDEVTSWEEMMAIVKDNLYITKQNTHVIASMYAAQLSHFYPAEPIWLFVVGPASSGKTTLIEAFGTNNMYCEAHSELHAKLLSSGFSRKGGEDPSLLPKLPGRSLFIKDYTTVLSMSGQAQDELYAILRDAFDGSYRKQYGNFIERNYGSLKFTMICGVTNAIHRDSRSSLGERFLKIDYLDEDFDEMEHIRRAMSGSDSKEKRSTILSRTMLGYLHHLIETRPDSLPSLPWDYRNKISLLAILVAHLRAQVERRSDDSLLYRPAREVASRIAIQLSKMTRTLMIVLQKSQVDQEVYEIIRSIALSSSVPFNVEFARLLQQNPEGLLRSEITQKLQIPSTNCHRVLTDLTQLRICSYKLVRGKKGRPGEVYRLSPQISELWQKTILEPYEPVKVIRRPPISSQGESKVRRRKLSDA